MPDSGPLITLSVQRFLDRSTYSCAQALGHKDRSLSHLLIAVLNFTCAVDWIKEPLENR